MAIFISKRVQEKLEDKHGGVSMEEIRQCFANIEGNILYDTRAQHITNPITRWFISETNFGRQLKIAYIEREGNIHIKTAYAPDDAERKAYAEGNK